MPLDLINNKYNKQILIKHDSLIEVTQYPLVGWDNFQIMFTDAFFDEAECKIRLIGKSCYKDTVKCTVGFPGGIQIFKARPMNHILFDQFLLGETLEANDFTKNGLFDVTFFLKKDESLFFFLDGFYLEEYKLGNLLVKKELLCSKN
jgi:hypothetical protein